MTKIDIFSGFLGAGKTCNMLASMLQNVERLTVVTTSITAVLELAECPNASVTLLGGDVHAGKNYIETLDPDISHVLRSFYFDKVFITVDGIDLEHGITTSTIEEAKLTQVMMRSASKIIILADSSKFGQRGFGRICSLEEIDVIVTDSRISEQAVAMAEEAGVDLVIA